MIFFYQHRLRGGTHMKKAWMVWTVLWVMAVSAAGFSEINVSRDVGVYMANQYEYVNETLNLKFAMSPWTRAIDKNVFAREEKKSVPEWLKSVEAIWTEPPTTDIVNGVKIGLSRQAQVWSAFSQNGRLSADIYMGKLTYDHQIADAEIENMILNNFRKSLRSFGEYSEENLPFLNETRTILKIKRADNGETNYQTFSFMVRNGYYAIIRTLSQGADLNKSILDKFSVLK